MKHHKAIRKLGRKSGEREALLRSLAVSLLDKGKIKTTEAKAKELRPFVEKLITKGKNDTLAARRTVLSTLGNPGTVKKVFDEIGPRYKERKGGYTRIIKTEMRANDASQTAVIELV